MSSVDTRGYVAWSVDASNREKSTSGGLFYEIAKSVLEMGGVVYGAVFSDEYSVVHVRSTDIDEVKKMRGSKYVQSRVGEVFVNVKNDLRNRKVLFTGTPCQIAGLKGYLQRDYDNLVCMDFVCLGVPSPGIWEEYLKVFHKRDKITNIVFKDKLYGWSNWTFLIESTHGLFRQPGRINLYMQGYLQHLYIRPSCYDCKFRKVHHLGDITVADCWGIDKLFPEINDEKGISAVLVHSDLGNTLIHELAREKICCREVEVNKLLAGNPYATKKIVYNSKKEKFVKEYNDKGIEVALHNNLDMPPRWKRFLQVCKWRLISWREYNSRRGKSNE